MIQKLLKKWQWMLLLAPALGSAAQTVRPPTAPSKPNVIVIVADDMGYADTGFNGCKDIPTPHLDSLARSGVRFSNGYVSAPLCGPSRAAFITGRYGQRFGHEFNPPPGGLDRREKTIGDRMKAAGYATAILGKWHLGSEPGYQPFDRGFDEFFGFLGGSHGYFEADNPRNKKGPIMRGRDTAPLEGYLTDVLAKEAVSFVERHSKEPFFLYLSFNAVHTPLEAPDEDKRRFASIEDPKRRTYAAMAARMDEAVGRVMAALRDQGVHERTLVFFFSDNGGPISPWTTINGARNHPLRGGKSQPLEGGIRVPFVVSWPGTLPAGTVDDRPVITLDILPTALGAAGVPTDPAWKLDGVNLLPYLAGKLTGTPHEALFWRHHEQWAVRKGKWKLVSYSVREPEAKMFQPALYDLTADIGEERDLSSQHPAVVRDLRASWEKWNEGNRPPVNKGARKAD